MKAEKTLRDMAALFLALGDGTRLRVLNLIRHGEICVSSFTDVLSQSQPKISRHLAYLRNAGLVEARRDGKWMHYSVASGLDEKTRLLLQELFKWMEDQSALQRDTSRYAATGHEIHSQAFLPLLPEVLASTPGAKTSRKRATAKRHPAAKRVEPEYFEPVAPVEQYQEPVQDYDDDRPPRHNELEDFLL
jgi:ArsR family transcriptional regulator, arsenate/arsenite/antimonite-responsive transcriptional repressor